MDHAKPHEERLPVEMVGFEGHFIVYILEGRGCGCQGPAISLSKASHGRLS
jgi:hypothetical protein